MTLTSKQNISNLSTTHYHNDPLAKKTAWYPLKESNLPLTNMILKSVEGSLEFHLSILSRLFYAIFIALGSLFILYATYALLSYHFQTTFISVAVGFTLLGFGIYMFSKHDIALIFDKRKNIFVKESDNAELKDKIKLDEVHALQLLAYEDETPKAELNLVLEDGHRLHVCSYENDEHTYEKIQEDASKIANYINKPVWNALETK